MIGGAPAPRLARPAAGTPYGSFSDETGTPAGVETVKKALGL